MFRSLIRTLGVVSLALAATACTGEIVVDSVTTDFGDAIAISERSDSGDISSWLTTRDQQRTLASLQWEADSGDLSGDVAGHAIDIEGTMQLASLPIEDLNLLVYSLWEVESAAPTAPTCVSNAAVLCCRADAWSCRARAQ